LATIKTGSQSAFRKVDYEYPRQFAICKKTKQGQNFLIISSLNANAKSSNFYLKTKGDIQDFLKCELSVAVLQLPSLGNRAEFRFGEKVGAFSCKRFHLCFKAT
jgi:hypothetical protein